MSEQISNAGLVDLLSVRVDSSLPKQERITEYVRQIKNPKRYMCVGWDVTEEHPIDGPSLEDCLQRIADVRVCSQV